MERLHLQIYGRVQGVGFRYACSREALSLGLKGWVRNLPDDSVEVVAEGAAEPLQAFENWCGHGPPHARVEHVVRSRDRATGEFQSFTISDAWGS